MSDTATISMFARLVFAAEAWADTHPGLADLLREAADALVNIAADRDSWEQQASDRTDDAVTFAAAARAAHIANAARVLKWADERPRRAPNLAFPAGPERQAAYWIEWAEQREISIAQAGIDAVQGSAALSAP